MSTLDVKTRSLQEAAPLVVLAGFFQIQAGLLTKTVKTDSCEGEITGARWPSLDEVKLLPRPTASGKTLVGRGS
jgi:hypothetical protein